MRRIPVFSGPRIHALVATEQALKYAEARNATVTYAKRKKRGERLMVRIDLRSMGDETKERSRGTVGPVYEESLDAGHVNVLSIIAADGAFRRWHDTDGFNPRRFNPDSLVPRTTVERLRTT